MQLNVSKTPLDGLFLLKPKVFGDSRGYFFESYNRQLWQQQGIGNEFVQDNQSLSVKGTLRGLHFQKPPYAQAKLVRVIQGSVLDVAVDIRKGSATYGQHFSLVLSGEDFQQLYIPEGFAHGFLTLEDDTIFTYKCSAYYYPGAEEGLMWDDPALGIMWGTDKPLLSAKDEKYRPFREFESPF